ncbi:unnamed protein product [Dicrocoelium dendriticum]|nr:unnamed protein product [Dicrocoelium dendriticum]
MSRKACVLIDQLLLYQLSCPAIEVNLMRFPQTPTGYNAESRAVDGNCITGSVSVLSDTKTSGVDVPKYTAVTMAAFCTASGEWRLNQQTGCVCDSGYEYDRSSHSCQSYADNLPTTEGKSLRD